MGAIQGEIGFVNHRFGDNPAQSSVPAMPRLMVTVEGPTCVAKGCDSMVRRMCSALLVAR